MSSKHVSVMTICGCGVGSSILLGVSIKKMLEELGFKADIKECDVTTCKGVDVDIVVNQPTWMHALKGMRSYKRCVVVQNIVSKKEVGDKIKAALEDLKWI